MASRFYRAQRRVSVLPSKGANVEGDSQSLRHAVPLKTSPPAIDNVENLNERRWPTSMRLTFYPFPTPPPPPPPPHRPIASRTAFPTTSSLPFFFFFFLRHPQLTLSHRPPRVTRAPRPAAGARAQFLRPAPQPSERAHFFANDIYPSSSTAPRVKAQALR